MGKESEIQRDILDYLGKRGYMAWRNHVQGIRLNGKLLRNPNRGQPDVWAAKHGRLIGIEVKDVGGRLSTEQLEWIDRAQRYDVPIIVVHSVGDLIETLQELRWERDGLSSDHS